MGKGFSYVYFHGLYVASKRSGDLVNMLTSAYPLGETEIVLQFTDAIMRSTLRTARFRFESGIKTRGIRVAQNEPRKLILKVGPIQTGIRLDRVTVNGLRTSSGDPLERMESPPFIHGIRTPMELKVPYFEREFPYASTLVGSHVTVMCCGGCNGGIHPRGLVVLNTHSGGPFSGIWVRTGLTIPAPYPRWVRVMFLGGVIEEQNGSTAVVDKGWMTVAKDNENAHHAPPPLPIETVDLPVEKTTDLLAKSLDASWVEFKRVRIESIRHVSQSSGQGWKKNLPRSELVISDKSGGRSKAWLYMKSRERLRRGKRLRMLRGFVHAEGPGIYVLLSDKEEDIAA